MLKSPPWLPLPNSDDTEGFEVVYYAGFVVGVTPPNNPPETTGFDISTYFWATSGLGFYPSVFCAWPNNPPLPNDGVFPDAIFPVKLNFGASVDYLGPWDGWLNNDGAGVATLPNNPPYAGFFYSYFLVTPLKSEVDAKGWFGFENNVDSAADDGNNPPYFFSLPENNPPVGVVLWGVVPNNPLGVPPNNVLVGFSYFFC